MDSFSASVGEPTALASEPRHAAAPPGLWVLDKADTLLGEIAAALWLLMASVWRVPLLLARRDGLRRLEQRRDARGILPPRLNMLVAAIISALFFVEILPDRTAHAEPSDAIGWLTSTSPEQWLVVAAPALVGLWFVIEVVAALLRLAAGKNALDPRSYVTYTLSAAAIIACLAFSSILWFEPFLKSVSGSLADRLVIMALLLIIFWLGWAGWHCVRQISPQPQLVNNTLRRCLTSTLGAMTFITAAFGGLTATYQLIQVQATIIDFIKRDSSPRPIQLRSPTCFITEDALLCGALMTSKIGYAVGGEKSLEIKWGYAGRDGPFQPLRVTDSSLRPTIVSPKVEPGSFWSLEAGHALPLVVRIGKADACAAYGGAEINRRKGLSPPNEVSAQPSVSVTVIWHGGFALTNRDDAAFGDYSMSFIAEDFNLAYGLQTLCADPQKAAAP